MWTETLDLGCFNKVIFGKIFGRRVNLAEKQPFFPAYDGLLDVYTRFILNSYILVPSVELNIN